MCYNEYNKTKEVLKMYVIMHSITGRNTTFTKEIKEEAVLAYAARGFKSLFIKGYTLTNAI